MPKGVRVRVPPSARNSIIEDGSDGTCSPHNGMFYDLLCWNLTRKRYLPELRCWK